MIEQARRCLDAGAYMIMIESEGITENVRTWRTDVVAKIVNQLGLERASREDAAWLARILDRESRRFGTRIEVQDDNHLEVVWR